MRYPCLCLLGAMVLTLLAPLLRADSDAIVEEIKKRQQIIAGQLPGGKAIARKELKELITKLAKEQGKEQAAKAAEWLEGQANDLGIDTSLSGMYQDFNRYRGKDSVVGKEMVVVKSLQLYEKKGDIEEKVEHVKRGYAYAKRLYELSGVFKENDEPAAQRLAGNLGALADLMSNYGGDLPLIGAIIAAYGDVTTQMLNAVKDIDKKLNARNPWLNDVSYGSSNLMRAYKNQLSGTWLKPVLGLRDTYIADDPTDRVFIFDPTGKHKDAAGKEHEGAFVHVRFYAPFNTMSGRQTVIALRRRYMMFANAGVKTPTVRQVLHEAGWIIRPDIRIDHAAIQAGQGFPFRVEAFFQVDGKPVPRGRELGFTVSQDEGFWGTQEDTCALGQTITWPAPDAAGTFTVSVDLDDASKKKGWRLPDNKPVTAKYVVGTPTVLKLIPAATRLAATRQQPLPVTVQLTDADGQPLTAGDLTVNIAPAGIFGLRQVGSYLDPRAALEFSGNYGELKSPLSLELVPYPEALPEANVLHLVANYKDKDKRLASTTCVLRVQEPRVVDGSRVFITPRQRDDGTWDFTCVVRDDTDARIPVGSVELEGVDGGHFLTYRGEQDRFGVELRGRGRLHWRPPPKAQPAYRFKVKFSGGAWQDAVYSPVETTWALRPETPPPADDVFVGAVPPADLPEPLPDLPAELAGLAQTVSEAAWKALEAASELLPPSPQTPPPAADAGGNIFAGIGIPGAKPVTPPATPQTPPPAADAGNANIFAGIGIPGARPATPPATVPPPPPPTAPATPPPATPTSGMPPVKGPDLFGLPPYLKDTGLGEIMADFLDKGKPGDDIHERVKAADGKEYAFRIITSITAKDRTTKRPWQLQVFGDNGDLYAAHYQRDIPFQKKQETWYDDHDTVVFRAGWYDSGQPRSYARIENGTTVDTKAWYEDGTLKSDVEITPDGRKTTRSYYEDGTRQRVVVLLNDKMERDASFTKSGAPSSVTIFDPATGNQVDTKMYQDGKLTYHAIWVNGKPVKQPLK